MNTAVALVVGVLAGLGLGWLCEGLPLPMILQTLAAALLALVAATVAAAFL
jgi:hypothetical protein